MTALTFSIDPATLADCTLLTVIGRRHRLLSPEVMRWLPPGISAGMWSAMVGAGDPGDDGRAQITWRDGSPARVVAAVLPDACSRHNAPSRAWAIPGLVGAHRTSGKHGILVALDDDSHALPTATGIARAFPTYSASGSSRGQRATHAVFLAPGGPPDTTRLQIAADAVRRAAHLVDMPPSELGPRAMLEEARAVAARTGATLHTIVGPDLREQGFGGLWGVGKAATEPPALVVLDHDPAPGGSVRSEAWVGKGILFDTGGLSMKDKSSMPGMKTDMGGAAAVLAAFEAAVKLGLPTHLTAVLCLAENAVGPNATRPDDILRLYSGRTVEINNTDAEGRLVLADGIAWVQRHRKPATIIDLATLTGAQAIATGRRHAAIISNDPTLEARALEAGRRTGDLCHALPFAPELLRREFQSRVADMKNSVKDRNNAQSSCAAEFIHLHMDPADTPWLHVDLAAPAVASERGTGFGVSLLLGMAGLFPA